MNNKFGNLVDKIVDYDQFQDIYIKSSTNFSMFNLIGHFSFSQKNEKTNFRNIAKSMSDFINDPPKWINICNIVRYYYRISLLLFKGIFTSQISRKLELDQLNKIFVIRIISVHDWNDWFSGSPDLTIQDSYSSQITLNGNTLVTSCVFVNIFSSISLISDTVWLLCVEECSFIQCYRSDKGGAISFFFGSNCILHKICAYKCNGSTSFTDGQFCYIKVKSGTSYRSTAHQISVCMSAHLDNDNQYYSMYYYYGNISLNNVNSSYNKCAQYSGIYIANPSISRTIQTTFWNNTDSFSRCIYFYGYTHSFIQCNIIKNYQKQTTSGTIYSYNAQTTFSNCIIDMNIGAENTIHAYLGSFTLQSCYLQSDIPPTGNIIINSPISESQSLPMNHFGSEMCPTLITLYNDVVITNNNIPKLNFWINIGWINLVIVTLTLIKF